MSSPSAHKARWTDHQQYVQLLPPREFSFSQVLGYLSRSPKECMFYVEGDALLKLIPVDAELGGGYVLVQISSPSDDIIRIDFLHPTATLASSDQTAPLAPRIREAAARYVWDWFDLDTDLTAFYEAALQDPLLALAIPHHYGLRLVGIADLFEALCWGIMGQQINLPFAYTLKARFVETYGQSLEWNGRKHWIFPEPSQIAGLTVNDLTPLQLTTKKAEYLIGVAGVLASGRMSKDELLAIGEPKAIEKKLTELRGIGPWTAHYVLMRCLRIPSAFPIEDVGLHNAIKQLLQLDAKPTIRQIEELSADWGEWKAYATFYLWRTIY